MHNDSFPGWDSIKGWQLSKQELDREFNAVMNKALAIERPVSHLRPSFRKGHFKYAFAAAFAIILAVGIALGINGLKSVTPLMAETVEYITGKGQIREVTLPDDSKVVLNSGTVLICPKKFGQNRSVYLMGEAVFEVVSSDTHPFIVRTSDISLRVHGTKFNVKAYFDDTDVRTTLCSGAVEIWANDRVDRRTELEPGQTLIYDKSGKSMIVTHSGSSEAISWASRELYFHSETIQGVIRILERHFNVNIYLMTDKYDDAVITANFKHGETLEDLLKAIVAVIPGMKYTIDENKVYLK